ncbi:alkaline phosphatase family protein, partial [bacterium]|nr:alkaline phosphatase family protein [bacterium]
MAGLMRRVVLIFVDGFGIGSRTNTQNPFLHASASLFDIFQDCDFPVKHFFDGLAIPLSCDMNVAGLPQSATGQTAILTGINTSQYLGRHLSGFPNKQLQKVIYKKSVLMLLRQAGKNAVFLNAYPPIFFERPREKLSRFLSVTSHAALASGARFFDFEDVRKERSLYQDFTNQLPIQHGAELPVFSPEKAGRIMAEVVADYDFSLYEYFQTDRAGHSQSLDWAVQEIEKLSRFMMAFLTTVDLETTQVIFTSDHGNIEDLSVKAHTMNPAMSLFWGPESIRLANR